MLVDDSKSSLDVISKNTDTLMIKDRVRVVKSDAISFIERSDLAPYDMVYLDPPYRYAKYGELISKMMLKVQPHTIVIAESDRDITDDITIPVEILKVKKWGKSKAFFFRKK